MECQRRKLVYKTLEESHGPIFATEFVAKFWKASYCVCRLPQCDRLSTEEGPGASPAFFACRAVFDIVRVDNFEKP